MGKAGRLFDIEQLVSSIKTEGLLQNLVVHCISNGHGDHYAVDAGGRRLAAREILVRRKKIARDHLTHKEAAEAAKGNGEADEAEA